MLEIMTPDIGKRFFPDLPLVVLGVFPFWVNFIMTDSACCYGRYFMFAGSDSTEEAAKSTEHH